MNAMPKAQSLDALSSFESRLKQVASRARLLKEPDDLVAYASDWTRTPGKASAVVLPADADEVAAVLKLCAEEQLAVVPSGGRTGLAGGAVAAKGEIVLSLERLNRILALNPRSRSLRVQAGVTTQAVHEHCAKQDLFWPIDLASKGSCQVGGNLSTNAGGLRVIRYGNARKWVTSLQVATMSGKLIDLNHGLEKNNTGYDLLQLVLGSEGTLVVITEATLKLVRLPKAAHKGVYLFGLPSLQAMDSLFEIARRGPFEISAFEFFSDDCLSAVEGALGRQCRLSSRSTYYAIIEVEGTEQRDSWLQTVLETSGVEDGMEGISETDQREIWGLREGITESLQRRTPVRKYDVCVPVAATSAFLDEALKFGKNPKWAYDLFTFGHFGDGSPHFNLVPKAPLDLERFRRDGDEFEKFLFSLLKSYRGSVSAEHGVGMLKRHWVQFSRTAEELTWFRAIKQAFDPQGLLNPGKLLPDPT